MTEIYLLLRAASQFLNINPISGLLCMGVLAALRVAASAPGRICVPDRVTDRGRLGDLRAPLVWRLLRVERIDPDGPNRRHDPQRKVFLAPWGGAE
jgi:hypothetical protein